MKSPFQEEIVLDNYYASSNAEHVLHTIRQAIADGVRLLVLSGDEGSGKTMICHKLDQDQQNMFTTVFFPRTVDSFEDVVRIVALALGLEPQLSGEGRSVDVLLGEISESLLTKSVPVLLIFDEAENIYLATLERIRKMLDRISSAGGLIHVLFAGRKTFMENSQQLSMCDFQNNEEYHIALAPLSEEETEDYLYHCSSKISGVDGGAIYTSEVIRNIFEVSGGNFRMTNILAEEALHKDGDDTSFMVLLENVKEKSGEQSRNVGFMQLVKEYGEQYRSYIPYAGAAIGVVVLSLVFLSFGKKAEVVQESTVTEVQVVEQPVVIKIESAKESEKDGSHTIKVPNAAPVKEVDLSASGAAKETVIATTTTPDAEIPEVEIDVEEQTKFSAPVKENVPVVTERAKNKIVVEAEVVEEVVKNTPLPVEEIEVVTLLRDVSSKKRPGRLPKTTQVTIKEEIQKEKNRNEVREVIASNAHFTVEQLYKKRLMAGTPWYNGQKNDKFTVQLMVLTSETAEKNLKKMLREDRYRQEAGNFYIFKKLSTSDTIFVFYGEYATIAQARLAQNSLPRFLRDHKPYAISVKGAMTKVRR
ncbi:AAA family ATPase [Desulforhopalus sp. 52FAK]